MADGANVLETPAKSQNLQRDKQQVARSFSQAANSYDGLARLQRQLGDRLLQQVQPQLSGIVLDVGSGTGVYSEQMAALDSVQQVLSLDLAAGMLDFARSHRPHTNIYWVQADAEGLPLADNCVDAIFANLSLQWSENPKSLFAELQRVLKPGGTLAFNTLGPDTLHELRTAWSVVDPFVHVNQFISVADIVTAMPRSLLAEQFTVTHQQFEYQHLYQLLQELKGIGASNHNSGRPLGLGGRQRLQTLAKAYERFRSLEGLLPASYEVICGLYRKSS